MNKENEIRMQKIYIHVYLEKKKKNGKTNEKNIHERKNERGWTLKNGWKKRKIQMEKIKKVELSVTRSNETYISI